MPDGGTGPAAGTFASLRHKNYRLFWIGNLISYTGDWLDQVALNWLVISTTGSPLMLALVNLGRGLPMMVLGLVGGVVADRVDRRLLMMVTQTLAMLVAILMAVVVLVMPDPVWTIMVLATCRGVTVAFNLPARHSLIYELVPRQDLASAVALNSIGINMAKILGPLAAAGIIAAFGIATCFAVNALSFTVILAMLFMIDLPRKLRDARKPEPFFRSLSEGLAYIRRDPVLLLLVLVALVPVFFCQPYLQFLAVFAAQVFEVGAQGLGAMTALAAAGSICGGVLAARLQRDSRKGSVMLAFMGGFGGALVLFSLSPNVWAAMPLLFATGAMHIAYNSSNNTILQLSVDDAYRGRVLSTMFVTRGLVPMGTAAMAGLAALVGARGAMGLMAGVVVLFAVALWFRAPRLRNLRV